MPADALRYSLTLGRTEKTDETLARLINDDTSSEVLGVPEDTTVVDRCSASMVESTPERLEEGRYSDVFRPRRPVEIIEEGDLDERLAMGQKMVSMADCIAPEETEAARVSLGSSKPVPEEFKEGELRPP